MTRTRRCIATFVAACIGFGGLAQTAQAGGLISAEQVAASVGLRSAADRRADLLAMTPHGWRASAERRATVIEEDLEVTVSIRYDWIQRANA